jgi:hypothetical protein
MVIDMESFRCKMAAVKIDDPRCSDLLTGVTIGPEDLRCINLLEGLVLEVDDPRCKHVHVKMEDPRCWSLNIRW